MENPSKTIKQLALDVPWPCLGKPWALGRALGPGPGPKFAVGQAIPTPAWPTANFGPGPGPKARPRARPSLAIPLFHASGLGTPSFPQGRKLHGPHGRLALARIRSQDPKGCGRAMPGMILTGYGFGYSQFRITGHSQAIRGGDPVQPAGHQVSWR